MKKLLERGTRAHYDDAAYYERAYARRHEDVAFYRACAERWGGPVLELGIGSGRVARAIAETGSRVVGVDANRAMLKRARAVLPETVELHRGDIRNIRLRRKFPLVISPFNVFMHLYSRPDVERALATVRAHLAHRGRFVFDVLLPQPSALARDPDRRYKHRPLKRPDGHLYDYFETFQYDAISQVQLITMAFRRADRIGAPVITPLAHRQFFPAELEALLHYNGFEIRERYGDFLGAPLIGDSESQVLICTRRKAPR